MDQCGSSQDISSKVVIKDELDIECEDFDNGCGGSGEIQESHSSMSIPDCDDGFGRSNEVKIKQESYSSISMSDAEYGNSDMKEDDDFVIDDYEKRCCVWLKESPTPLLLQEPNLPLISLPEGTEIIKVKPIKYTRPMRFQRNNDGIKVSSSSRDFIKKEKRNIKHELEALGVIWASKLLRLQETQRVLAEDLINQILKKGFFKDLTPNTTLYDSKYHF